MKVSCNCFILCYLLYILHTCEATCDENSKSIFTLISEKTFDEDGKLNFTQLVNKYGRSVKQHRVVTEDGYILTIFNIPGNKKRPVLLLHGLFDSSDTYIVRGNNSLGITLANSGYDVWFGNNRGNLYGRHHVTLDPDRDEEFWDYSFHEIGFYDLAATIDYVREKTGAKKISTVGHSQGTTAHFVLTSSRPEYNQRIKVFIALAPVAILNHVGLVASALSAAAPAIVPAFKLAGINELLRDHQAASNVLKFICSKGLVSYLICSELIFPLAGFDLEELEPKYVTKVAFGHFPRGISRKCLQHYAQLVRREKFAQFDYGLKNIVKYGRIDPPEYNLTEVRIKVALFTGGKDELGTVKDVKTLKTLLPNVVHDQVIESWGHLAFVAGRNMPKYLFPNLMRILKKYD